jgi:hypothetical protein
MIFVRNENGSHNPHEAMEIDDVLDACAVLTCSVADQASQAEFPDSASALLAASKRRIDNSGPFQRSPHEGLQVAIKSLP